MMIGLFAGTGDLPAIAARHLREAGRVSVICELEGQAPEIPLALPRLAYRIETLGGTLETLRLMGVGELCLLGALRRPELDPARLDAKTRPLMSRLTRALAQGDDGTLRALIAILEEQGFTIKAVQDLVPGLLPEAGVLTDTAPPEGAEADAGTGEAEIARMGQADLGQTCVVRDGQVIAREGPDGTDAMLAGLAGPVRTAPSAPDPVSWLLDTASDIVGDAADWLSNTNPGRKGSGAILVKAPKPGQDRRADLPVIGPGTARRAVEAGLSGLVIEAGGVMIIDRAETCAILDAGGAFLWVRPRGGGG